VPISSAPRRDLPVSAVAILPAPIDREIFTI
jgi:hypothetical protein